PLRFQSGHVTMSLRFTCSTECKWGRCTGMKTLTKFGVNGSDPTENPLLEEDSENGAKPRKRYVSRRSFLSKTIALGAGTMGVGLLSSVPRTARAYGGLSSGDAALLRFPAALELLEADFWIQYNELGGIQDDEVPGGSGNPDYSEALEL